MSNALTLELKNPPSYRIDMRSLTPCQLTKKTNREIALLPLFHGNRKIRVGDLFKVSGRDKTQLHILSDSPRLDAIAASMQQGSVHVEGVTGAYAGMEMRAGELTIHGDAGDYTGAGMVNGTIKIQRNSGNYLGAALAGERQGLRGGCIIVMGNAGDRSGDRMRRGTIIIHGDCGDYTASRMIAGSLVVMGKAGKQCGYNMRRGSLLLNHRPSSITPTFNYNGLVEIHFLQLFIRHLSQLDQELYRAGKSTRVQRYLGDVACGGMGEIMFPGEV